jgi:hypothetical protein
MKSAQFIASVSVTALALSLGALAKDSNSGNFTVSDKVQIGSTQLAPGNYKAEWTGPANDVKVVITQHGKTVATAEGKLTTLQQPSRYSAVLTKQTNNNTLQLDEIEFNNRSEALQLGGE